MQGQLIAGRYQITEHMKWIGEVNYYAAKDVSTGQAVTLRTINIDEIGAVGIGLEHLAASKLRRKMENESRILEQLDHPGLLTLLDYGFDNPIYYHAYPSFAFYNLQMMIEANGRIPTSEMLDFTAQAASTLADLHQSGIIHCDISAENLLLLDSDIKVIEFTIANHEENEGAAPGSPPYMSPEAIQGARPAPSRDVWALGVTLYYGLAGVLPFGDIELPREQGVPVLFMKILQDAPEPITRYAPEIPTDVVGLINRMLEKDPLQRIDDMNEVKRVIDGIGR